MSQSELLTATVRALDVEVLREVRAVSRVC